MKDIPIFRYKDAWKILAYNKFNGTIVDDYGEVVLIRIEKTMARLQVMGDDERRCLWIRSMRTSHEYEWLKIMTAHYNDFHYLILSDGSFRYATLKNKKFVDSKEKKDQRDFTEPLLALESHVNAVVDWICDNPKAYNTYVNHYLPYSKRSGDISRKILYEIDPKWNHIKEPNRLINGLETIKSAAPTLYQSRTLRTYITVWCAAYRTLTKVRYGQGYDDDEKEILLACKDFSDTELFKQYNSKGEEIEILDLDSTADYLKWYYENSSFHCMDVSYARIHLSLVSDDYDETGPFHFCIHFGVFGYFEEVAEIAISLFNQGTVVKLDGIEDILNTLRLEDMIGFRPWPDKYKNRDGVASQTCLPYIGEVSKETYWKIIRATSWHKEHEVLPI